MAPEPKRVAGKPDACPACGRRDIRPSVVRGVRDGFMRMFSYSPYRCRACEHRFYRHMTVVEEAAAETQESTAETADVEPRPGPPPSATPRF